MTKILIVDDDAEIAGLSRTLIQKARPDWKVFSVTNPLLVAQEVARHNFDAVISDLEMPTLPGNLLLTQIALAEPLIIRFMLSSRTDSQQAVEALGIAHRVFAKPCDYGEILQALDQALALRKRLRGSRLRSLIQSIPALPSAPKSYFALQQLLANEQSHSKKIVALLKDQMALTAFVLKAANSSYYGARQRIESLERAVQLLGTNTIRSLVLGAELFAQIDARKAKAFGVDRLFEHSARVASVAASLAERRPETRHLKDLAFTAGLLHDIGKLVCIHCIPDKYKLVVDKAAGDYQALYHEEIAVLGVSHQEIGAYLLSLWGIPEPIVEAVAYHHQPLLSPQREVSVLTFVVAANMLDHGLPDAEAADEPSEVGEYLDSLGMGSRDLVM